MPPWLAAKLVVSRASNRSTYTEYLDVCAWALLVCICYRADLLGQTAADSPANRTEASPLAHCSCFPEAPLFDAAPARALVLARKENA